MSRTKNYLIPALNEEYCPAQYFHLVLLLSVDIAHTLLSGTLQYIMSE